MAAFVRDECEPLDLLFPRPGDPYDVHNKASRAILAPLREKVKEQGLWACHLGPELGGQGYGQLKLALMNEILGRSGWAPTVFGTAAPDTGNAEILALYGTAGAEGTLPAAAARGQHRVDLLDDRAAGRAPTPRSSCARRRWDGDEWVIEGEKWFSSHARYASFFIVMVVTDPDAKPYERMSMLIVPAETPGIEIIRNVATMNERDDLDEGTEGYIRYNQVRVPLDAMLGAPGEGFKVAQSRLGGGRVHHAMRVVGKCQRAFDMMCERALSRRTQGKLLAEHQFVQGFIADSAIQLQQFRLLVLQTAWIIDNQPHGAARTHIAMCKVALAAGAARRPAAGGAAARVARHHPGDAARPLVGLRAAASAGRRADRGAQGGRRQGHAARLPAGPGPVPDRAHPHPPGRGSCAVRGTP